MNLYHVRFYIFPRKVCREDGGAWQKTSLDDTPNDFHTKQEYLDLLDKVRVATLSALAKMSDADFDKPTTGTVAAYAPTYGAAFLLLGDHQMMHAGQFTVLRRKLGKPVLF